MVIWSVLMMSVIFWWCWRCHFLGWLGYLQQCFMWLVDCRWFREILVFWQFQDFGGIGGWFVSGCFWLIYWIWRFRPFGGFGKRWLLLVCDFESLGLFSYVFHLLWSWFILIHLCSYFWFYWRAEPNPLQGQGTLKDKRPSDSRGHRAVGIRRPVSHFNAFEGPRSWEYGT